MRFGDQVLICLRWGLPLIALGFAFPIGAALLGVSGPEPLWIQVAYVLFALPGLLLVLGGAILRPASRLIWLHVAAPSTLTDQGAIVATRPAWRWWLHFDERGHDRDAP